MENTNTITVPQSQALDTASVSECPKGVSQDEYDRLMKRLDELEAMEDEEE